MSRAPRRPVALLWAALVLLTMTACELDFEIEDTFTPTNWEDSSDPKVQRAKKAKEEAKRAKAARPFQENYLRTNDERQLDDAIEKNPKDPELLAYKFLEAEIAEYEKRSRGGETVAEWGARESAAFREATAEAYKTKQEASQDATDPSDKLPPLTPNELMRQATRERLDAMAKMLVRGADGIIQRPSADAPFREQYLFRAYCDSLKAYGQTEEWHGDQFGARHALLFGTPC